MESKLKKRAKKKGALDLFPAWKVQQLSWDVVVVAVA